MGRKAKNLKAGVYFWLVELVLRPSWRKTIYEVNEKNPIDLLVAHNCLWPVGCRSSSIDIGPRLISGPRRCVALICAIVTTSLLGLQIVTFSPTQSKRRPRCLVASLHHKSSTGSPYLVVDKYLKAIHDYPMCVICPQTYSTPQHACAQFLCLQCSHYLEQKRSSEMWFEYKLMVSLSLS
ncbi:Uncharacterized protein TCM_021995 [Theobroma cacao]|uniref:Uncharacterized protein n=1 Tax=Theobroma cacao TaxID=3641 RepID=A0A061ERE7_THECC|nr:Uncharacterized protein TCM_021995 [Theobroma cacao]